MGNSVLNTGSDVQRHCFPKRRQSSGALLWNIGSIFPTSFGRHPSMTPKLKGYRPNHSAAMFRAVAKLHLKTPREKNSVLCNYATCDKNTHRQNKHTHTHTHTHVVIGSSKMRTRSHAWGRYLHLLSPARVPIKFLFFLMLAKSATVANCAHASPCFHTKN